MNPITTTIAGMLVAAGTRVIVTLLRLRWRSRQEHARQASLVTLTDRMPAESWLDEMRPDGSRLRLSVGARDDKDNVDG
jgi:hypothetical protein